MIVSLTWQNKLIFMIFIYLFTCSAQTRCKDLEKDLVAGELTGLGCSGFDGVPVR